ncbi:MAG: beta-N-acetylglucosaminidase [Candidatus Heimdallarchaeota archaeon]|nr:beta-N-acetylglucosaminidase [Candidatus Heimdallarchaeota archaeon]
MITIIPEPVELIIKNGSFKLKEDTSIYADKEISILSNFLREKFTPSTGFLFSNMNQQKNNQIQLKLAKSNWNLSDEGYILHIKKEIIEIIAKKSEGIFYGIQTLRQLLPPEIENQKIIKNTEWIIPCVEVKDYPRYNWRGFMLDEARHFMGKAIVKKILDLMALHKLNKFHWHLVDDQGWRIEIKKYPKLVEIGSKRKINTKRGEISNLENQNYIGGYYKQEEIKEIINYAKERFIEVIPEIEMPGHCSASLAAYPELSCTGGPFEVPTRWGIFFDVYCTGKENVYKFLEDVLVEVIELFPTNIIHIGGDEVPKKRWKSCPYCQQKMKELKFEKEGELQIYLTNYFVKFLESHGKRLMGWNQILNPTLSKEAICQFWLGNRKKVTEHMQKGGEVVATNYLQTYLDHPYQLISLKKAYKFEPKFPKVESGFKSKLLGIEAPLWTERVPNLKRLEWQIFPRLTAYAETAWTPKKKKDYEKFKVKLSEFIKRLEFLDVNVAIEKIN